MAAQTISKITRRFDLGATPARVNRSTGEMYINAFMWPRLTPEQRIFIMLHELGHVKLQTSDEFAADAFAFKKYADMGYSLKASITALSRVLPFTNQEQRDRLVAQYDRAAMFDYVRNGNKKAITNKPI